MQWYAPSRLCNGSSSSALLRRAGQINAALTMWEEAAAHYPAGDSKALARGPVQPLNLLCSLQEWFSSVAAYEPPANDGSVAGANVIRGYKDIEWTPESIEFLDLVFPCNRKVFNVREDPAAQEASQVWRRTGLRGERVLQ